ncbi:hypothetical protein CY34DRAFT_812334 [Suillus luteus UH-Slu-Lm8-n1]|uniref:Uncharacterized protein n=1 Tax=Suillus luteus UH-Slu-Lm8-n1 TaxID=930992 RepID=A0A0D0ATC6_9AGAM|nr:hypothetical protein CY34DRAFT_812334 [Suillus luteus UH-Slu-Lm8-n1]
MAAISSLLRPVLVRAPSQAMDDKRTKLSAVFTVHPTVNLIFALLGHSHYGYYSFDFHISPTNIWSV